jgi:putative ABC transport system ATP-binding protein
MPIVETRNLTKDYMHGRMTVPALRGVDLTIKAGEFTAVVGPSGSGKTTLLNLIGCLDRPTGGQILMDGKDISGYSPTELADLRRHKLGFIFQTYNLIPVLTAYENVELPLLLLGVKSNGEIKARSCLPLLKLA